MDNYYEAGVVIFHMPMLGRYIFINGAVDVSKESFHAYRAKISTCPHSQIYTQNVAGQVTVNPYERPFGGRTLGNLDSPDVTF